MSMGITFIWLRSTAVGASTVVATVAALALSGCGIPDERVVAADGASTVGSSQMPDAANENGPAVVPSEPDDPIREAPSETLTSEPVKPAEPEASEGVDTARGSGEVSAVEGEVYTWQDGDRTRRVRVLVDLVVLDEGAAASKDPSKGDVVAVTGAGPIVRITPRQPGADGLGGRDSTDGQPVFRSEGGALMALPGGVVVVLDPEWDAAATDAFFERNDISSERVSGLDWLANGFFVETDPGFASLELANTLAPQEGVALSSPNWWTEHVTR